MFKPERKEESINKTVRFPESLFTELSKVAQQRGISFNQLVVQSCRYAMNDLVEEKETTN